MRPRALALSGDDGAKMLEYLERDVLESDDSGVGAQGGGGEARSASGEQEIEKQLAAMKEPYDEETFQELLKQQNLTEEIIKENIELQMLVDQLFEKVTADVSMSEQEILDYFTSNYESLIQYKASHILIRPEGDAEDQEAADGEARKKAEDLIARLDQGADFAELARTYSADQGSAALGGSLGQFFTKDTSPYVPEFTEAVLQLAEGEYTGRPVKTDFGYHIIKLDEKLDSYEELQASLRASLELEEKNRVFYDYFSKAINQAKIVNHLVEKDDKAGKS
ncbi:MAG: peptidylprolyl isomerase [Bacillota bacterium]